MKYPIHIDTIGIEFSVVFVLRDGCLIIIHMCSLCPPNPEGGVLLVLVRIPSALASASAFVSVHYLLNQSMDFDQTGVDTCT